MRGDELHGARRNRAVPGLIQAMLGFCTLFGAAHAATVDNARSGLGINLTKPSYWATQWNTTDIMKHAGIAGGRPWATGSNSQFNTAEYHLLDLDENGWPRSLPQAGSTAQYRFLTTILYLDNPRHPGGKFVVRYDGQGSLRYSGARLVAAESRPGRHVVELAENGHFFLHIDATDPQKSGDYLRHIRVFAPGGFCDGSESDFAPDAATCSTHGGIYQSFEDAYPARYIHPLLLQDLKRFRTVRFMEMLGTVNSPIATWQQRPQPENMTWASKGGVPVEMTLEIANRSKAIPWLNLPVKASDDYVREFARLVRDKLDPALDWHVEYGNELWNTAWPYNLDGQWLETQGRAAWPTSTASLYTLRLNYYGRRSAEVCSIIKQEWGADAARVKCVMGAQSGNAWVASQSLACPLSAAQTGRDCAREMDALAIAPYFAGYFALNHYVPILNSWLADPVTGLDKMFAEIQSGLLHTYSYDPTVPTGQLPPRNGSLAKASDEIRANKQVADRFGLSLMAYEGGQHLSYAGNMQGERAAINSQLFLSANRDARMAEAYSRHLVDWRSLGGSTYVLFESIGRWGSYGAFPLKEYQTQTDSVKFNAVQQIIQDYPCWWAGCERPVP